VRAIRSYFPKIEIFALTERRMQCEGIGLVTGHTSGPGSSQHTC